jgi:hypothetical protein
MNYNRTYPDGRKTTEYKAWGGMKDRCYNPNSHKWKYYGGRGIKVCDRWRNSFENFLDDMGLKPASNLSIDRIDNDGDYEPGNCRWADSTTQSNNQRRHRGRKVKPEKIRPNFKHSPYTGVFQMHHVDDHLYFVHAMIKGKLYQIGYYTDLEEAISSRLGFMYSI